MTQNLHVQVAFPVTSGLPEDVVTNTFNLIAEDGFGPAEIAEVLGPIAGFYNTPVGVGPAPISNYMSSDLSRGSGAVSVKVFDVTGHLDASPVGSPLASGFFTLGADGGGTAMPSEVAIALRLKTLLTDSLPIERADGVDAGTAVDRPRQRRTGHLFLGPWQSTIMDAPSGRGRPSLSIMNRILAASVAFQNALDVYGTKWAVWSRVDAQMHAVTNVVCNDAYDIQNRRGIRPSSTVTAAIG